MEIRDGKFAKRCIQSEVMRSRYPDRVPLAASRFSMSTAQESQISCAAYLTCAELIGIFRQNTTLAASQAVFFVSIPLKRLLCGGTQVGVVYDSEKSADGFLHIACSLEDTFGK